MYNNKKNYVKNTDQYIFLISILKFVFKKNF